MIKKKIIIVILLLCVIVFFLTGCVPEEQTIYQKKGWCKTLYDGINTYESGNVLCRLRYEGTSPYISVYNTNTVTYKSSYDLRNCNQYCADCTNQISPLDIAICESWGGEVEEGTCENPKSQADCNECLFTYRGKGKEYCGDRGTGINRYYYQLQFNTNTRNCDYISNDCGYGNLCKESNDKTSCVKASEPPTPPSATCSDSDGGKNFYERGTVAIPTHTTPSATDYCSGSGQLIEYSCDTANDDYFLSQYSCSNGCENGVCKGTPPVSGCTDSDGGKNYLAKGITKKSVQEVEDKCQGNAVEEWFCSENDLLQSQVYPCQNIGNYICSGGACVKEKTVCCSVYATAKCVVEQQCRGFGKFPLELTDDLAEDCPQECKTEDIDGAKFSLTYNELEEATDREVKNSECSVDGECKSRTGYRTDCKLNQKVLSRLPQKWEFTREGICIAEPLKEESEICETIAEANLVSITDNECISGLFNILIGFVIFIVGYNLLSSSKK